MRKQMDLYVQGKNESYKIKAMIKDFIKSGIQNFCGFFNSISGLVL